MGEKKNNLKGFGEEFAVVPSSSQPCLVLTLLRRTKCDAKLAPRTFSAGGWREAIAPAEPLAGNLHLNGNI